MNSPEEGGSRAGLGTQRLDKWLWFARIAKSRTLAASLVAGGKMRVNRVKATKPSQTIKVGDVITSGAQKGVRILRVSALGARRGPAAEARTLYDELTPAAPDTKAAAHAPLASGERLRGSGRPTKRERRLTDRLKERNG